MIVDVAEFVFNEKHLEYASISISQKGMVVTCCSENQQFGKSCRYQLPGTFPQTTDLNRFCPKPMPLRCSHIVPV